MKTLVTVLAGVLLATGAATSSADSGKGSSSGSGRLDITITDFVTEDNQAMGVDGFNDSSAINASPAIAGSIVVEANCECSLSVDVTKMVSRNNIAIGNAVAGSVVIRTGASMN